MASEGNTGVVAIFAIMLLALLGGFIAWQVGVFDGGDGGDRKSIDVNVNTKK